MYDPQLAINKALYAAITSADILFRGNALRLYTHVPSVATDYVLLSQPTMVQAAGFAACNAWECTALLSIYIGFDDENAVMDSLALGLSEKVLAQLLGKSLPLGDDFQMSPITVAMATTTQSFNGDKVYVARVLRLRFTVYAER